MAVRPIGRAVFYRQVSQLPDRPYSRDELTDKARDVMLETIDRIPSILIPAGCMLAGGFVLAFARRSSKTHAA
jgi:hypothetical protein